MYTSLHSRFVIQLLLTPIHASFRRRKAQLRSGPRVQCLAARSDRSKPKFQKRESLAAVWCMLWWCCLARGVNKGSALFDWILTAMALPKNDIAQWNSAWEAHFESPRLYLIGPGSFDAGLEARESAEWQHRSWRLRESYMAGSRDRIRCLSSMQADLGVLAVTSILQPDFCWKKLTRAAREAHILEGLFLTCLNDAQESPAVRIYTSDITLTSLEKKSGTGFLNLLKIYVRTSGISVEDVARVSYPHPKWTTEKLQQLRETGYNDERSTAIVLLAMFLYNTTLSIIGTPRPPEIFAKVGGGVAKPVLNWREAHKSPVHSKKFPKKVQTSGTVYRVGKYCESSREGERNVRLVFGSYLHIETTFLGQPKDRIVEKEPPNRSAPVMRSKYIDVPSLGAKYRKDWKSEFSKPS
ncbi:hypothetical protein DFH09DRAFT_1413355 [Mycena vulgaris]|nr:hypothetical protein DFH09DRAFT_1413355 [Mycena vulgaris]